MARFGVLHMSLYQLSVFATLVASLALLPFGLCFSVLPWLALGMLCLTAPFVPRLSFFLPIVIHGDRKARTIALTFDDGPDPQTTPLLLELLSRRMTKAAFFVIGQKAERHPELIRELLRQGHEIGNHSDRHDVCLMLRSSTVLRRDLTRSQERLAALGIRPLAFRPPVGITNPHLAKVLKDLGMICCGFSCRAGDWGNRHLTGIHRKILRKIRGGDIVLLHDCNPRDEKATHLWLAEVDLILKGLKEREFYPILLSELIQQPVMELTAPTRKGNPDHV